MLVTTRTQRSWTVLFVCFITLFMIFSGCRKSSDSDDPRDRFSGYGTLPYLHQTSHPELSKEYAMLVERRHAPWQLMQKDEHPYKNMAVKLRSLLSEDKAKKIIEGTNFLVEKREFKFSFTVYPKIKKMAKEYEIKNQLIKKAVELPNCIFRYDFTKGYIAPDVFVERVWAAARLQEIAAANSLYNTRDGHEVFKSEDGKTTDASLNSALKETIDSIQTIFTLADQLGRMRQLRARLVAESIRREACRVIKAVTQDSRCNQKTLVLLREVVDEELTHWTGDAEMWIGERTYGLYYYEAIRDGKLFDVLAQEDEDRFRKEGILGILHEADSERLDVDQLYYLKKMRHLISQSRRDFHKRPLLGPKILEELQELSREPNYPIIAGELLLIEVDRVLLLQLIDLTRMRAWSVALDVATGKKPKQSINPITGKPFWIVQDKETVTVYVLPPDEDTKLDSPLDEEAVKFIASQLKQPVMVRKFL